MNPIREIAKLAKNEKLFVFFAMLTCFCIGSEYAITRPASQSIFLSLFSTQAIPYAWLWTVPLNLAVVTLYNRLQPRLGPLRIMGLATLAIISIHILTALIVPIFPQFIFFQYCWKDIYILLMFKQLWSMIHSTISSTKAKALYGAIFGMGTVGSILGSSVTGFFAPLIGSERLFLFTVPIYALLFFAYYKSYRVSNLTEKIEPTQICAREGFSMIAKNRYLLGVLLLVVFMQISVALVEYQFNHAIELAFPSKDLRTAYVGKLMGLINTFSLLIQFAGSFLLIQFLGLRRSHFLVPILLCSTALFQLFNPSFAAMAFAFIFTKSIDFSLFGVIREMLFVPLKLDEKFRAKAVIDVFAYRTSKAAASLLLLSLQFWVGSQVFALSNTIAIAIFALWLATVALLFRKAPQTAI